MYYSYNESLYVAKHGTKCVNIENFCSDVDDKASRHIVIANSLR